MKRRTSPRFRPFESNVYDAASHPDISQLLAALDSHKEFIDVPNPGQMNRTPMHAAAACGNVGAIETLVRSGSKSIDAHDSKRFSPLLLAAINRHFPAIEALVRLGSKSITTTNTNDLAAIHWAAINDDVEMIELLVRLDSNVIDSRTAAGMTALHHAGSHGRINAIEALVRLGSRAIDYPDMQFKTPMHFAVQKGHLSAVLCFLRLGYRPEKSGFTAVHEAAVFGRVDAVEMLIRLGNQDFDVFDEDRAPIHLAAANDRYECVRFLLALGASPDFQADPFRSAWFRVDQSVTQMSADEIAAIRYRVYFSFSLLQRLLWSLEVKQPISPTFRF